MISAREFLFDKLVTSRRLAILTNPSTTWTCVLDVTRVCEPKASMFHILQCIELKRVEHY